jgi:hypothetical protein
MSVLCYHWKSVHFFSLHWALIQAEMDSRWDRHHARVEEHHLFKTRGKDNALSTDKHACVFLMSCAMITSQQEMGKVKSDHFHSMVSHVCYPRSGRQVRLS